MTKEPLSLKNLGEPLAKLKKGQKATLLHIDDNYSQKLFLQELGFTESCQIEVLRKAPFGDPIHVRVRNAEFALRKADAKFLRVVCS